VIVQFRKSDTFGVPIELFVSFVLRHVKHSTRWGAQSKTNIQARTPTVGPVVLPCFR
jgi:hypothetical protein